jgi:hypothetical protein
MPKLVGFSRFAALLEEQISEKISRRILSGEQGMIVWWSIGAGVHVEPHSHANEQIVWMLKGKMDFRLGSEQRLWPRRRRGHSGRYGARGMVPRRHRGDRFLCASARRLSSRWQTRLHERRLNIRPPQPRLTRDELLSQGFTHRADLSWDRTPVLWPPFPNVSGAASDGSVGAMHDT